MNQYADFRAELLNSLREEVKSMIRENVLYLGCLINQKMNDLVIELIDYLDDEAYEMLKQSVNVDNIIIIVEKTDAIIEFVKNIVAKY